jgi:hypothetical protein
MFVAIGLHELRFISVEANDRSDSATIRFRNVDGDDLLSIEVPVAQLDTRTQIALSHLRNPTTAKSEAA